MADIRTLDPQSPRVETGPTQFGNDWPGIFIRGDNAASMASELNSIAAGIAKTHPILADFLRERFANLLSSCIVSP